MQRSLSVDQFQTVTVNHRELLSETGSNSWGTNALLVPERQNLADQSHRSQRWLRLSDMI